MNHFKKKLKYNLILGLFLLISLPVTAADKAYDIMKKNYALKKPSTVKNSSLMFILKAGGKEIKEFNLVSKRVNDQLRLRLVVTKPIPLDFISWSVPGKAAKQWITLGKDFKEITAGDMSGSFLGSHFSFSDLAEPYLDDYEYTYLGEADINNETCHKIEARIKNKLSVYTKTVLYLRKSDYFTVQVDFFEKKGHTKTVSFEKIEKINGIITAKKITMAKAGSNDKTIIVLKNIEYNVPVEENKLIPFAAYQ